MNTYLLTLNVKQQPETLERILRVVRHRGFKISELNLQCENPHSSNIYMRVNSEREIAFLTNQLNKLIDVLDCQQLVEKEKKSALRSFS